MMPFGPVTPVADAVTSDVLTTTSNQLSAQSTSRAPSWCDSISREDMKQANILLAHWVYRKALPFSLVDDKSFQSFIKVLRPSYRLPDRATIAGHMLSDEYETLQAKVVRCLQQFPTVCLTLDGVTNNAGNQVLNLMAAGPMPYVIEHFRMNLRRELSDNLKDKVLSVRRRLCIAMGIEHDSDADIIEVESQPCPRKPLWTLCTDSRKVLASGVFTFAYGCAPHALNNLAMDIVKFEGPKKILSMNVFIVNKINAVHLLKSAYNVLCREKLGKSYSLILFTKTRWSSCYFMLQRMLLVKSALVAMPHSILHNSKFADVSMDVNLQNAILDRSLWAGTGALEILLKPLCAAIGYLGGDEATLSAVYACFLSIAQHVTCVNDSTLAELSIDRPGLLAFVHARLKTIISPVHALAFVTDPFFYSMRTNLAARYGQDFLNLGSDVGLFGQCRVALQRIAGSDKQLGAILAQQFAYFLSMHMEQTFLMQARQLKPWLIWAQVDDANLYQLAKVLVKVHLNPSSAMGGERNHKTNNRVHSTQRIRLGEESCQRQVAIAFNSAQLQRVMQKKRIDKFAVRLSNVGSGSGQLPDREQADDRLEGEGPEDKTFEDESSSSEDMPEDEFRMVNDTARILDQYLGDESDYYEIVCEEGVIDRSLGHVTE